jgi:two-component system phosphate regulon sensor histidine kinase PhoR
VRLATRFFISSSLLVAATVLGLILAADRILRKELESETGAALEREARLVERLIPPDSTAWPAIAISLGQLVGHRVTLIDPSGRVRGDTEFPADALPGLENHATRPEVLQALATGVGRSTRYSVSTDLNRMYVAIRGGPPAEAAGAALRTHRAWLVKTAGRRWLGRDAGGRFAGRSATRSRPRAAGQVAAGVPRTPRDGPNA